MKQFSIKFNEDKANQLMAVFDFAIKNAGLQHEAIGRLGYALTDWLRSEAVDVPTPPTDEPK